MTCANVDELISVEECSEKIQRINKEIFNCVQPL